MTTDPRPLADQIDQVLDECDASKLPPIDLTVEDFETLQASNPSLGTPIDLAKVARTFRVPREMVEANPVPIEAQIAAEYATHVDRATSPPCCDLHNQHCEVPFNTCCNSCPEEVALAAFVAEHEQAIQREHQAVVELAALVAHHRQAVERERQALVDSLVETTHKHQSRLANWLLGLRRR